MSTQKLVTMKCRNGFGYFGKLFANDHLPGSLIILCSLLFATSAAINVPLPPGKPDST